MKDKQIRPNQNQVESVFSLYKNGQIKEALKDIKVLNAKYPNQPILFNIAGACYQGMGELEVAAKMFKTATMISADYAEAHFNLGVVLQELNKKDASIESYRKAIAISPKYPNAYNNLGNIFLSLGQLDSAIESFEWAIAHKHDFAEAYNNLGNAYNESLEPEKAIINFQKAISYNSKYEKAYFNLALVYKDLGNKEAFINYIEKVLALNPNLGHAYYHLSHVKKFTKDDMQIKQMQRALKIGSLDSIDRIGLNFALAKVFEDLEEPERQFMFLNEANNLRKKELNYTINKDKKLFARIKETFNKLPAVLEINESKPTSIKPIFIIGMPRSGTSLVHQIIDNHYAVHGLGELNYLNKFVVPLLKTYNSKKKESFSNADLMTLREKYLDSLPIRGFEENIIIDKMPLNFRYVGFILTAFPEAKIIHMERNPMASCWSIYKNEFRGNAYSFNQSDIAEYYGLYKDLMDFWNKLFPDKILNFCYEDLTKNQEIETKNLLRYCELDWDENCLNFYNNESAVKTTSSMQVKQKMYQGSSDAWKKYESFLQPLIKGLD
ncbi:MAG: tetratricopeptide repeat protein [Flavobacteriaceae bacterium]|nr:tetratricopeptide repeat protein [Flavobacteriaceae bacterium]